MWTLADPSWGRFKQLRGLRFEFKKSDMAEKVNDKTYLTYVIARLNVLCHSEAPRLNDLAQ